MQVGPDQVVPRRRRSGDAAGDLRRCDAIGESRERHRLVVGLLLVEAGPVDRAAVEARRRAGLEASESEAEAGEGLRQADRRTLTDPTRGNSGLADMDEAAEKGSGGQHDGGRRQGTPIREADAADGAALNEEVFGLSGDNRQAARRPKRGLHVAGIEAPVGLRARTPDRRALAAVQQPELNAGPIRDPAHESVEGVDLADEVPLPEPADGRIARHRPDRLEPVRDERRLRPDPRSSGRRLGAGMSPTDHDDIEVHGPGIAGFGQPAKGRGR